LVHDLEPARDEDRPHLVVGPWIGALDPNAMVDESKRSPRDAFCKPFEQGLAKSKERPFHALSGNVAPRALMLVGREFSSHGRLWVIRAVIETLCAPSKK
jgi:hypothetical protein